MGRVRNFFTRFFGRICAMFTKDIGIDLGTANTLCVHEGPRHHYAGTERCCRGPAQ